MICKNCGGKEATVVSYLVEDEDGFWKTYTSLCTGCDKRGTMIRVPEAVNAAS